MIGTREQFDTARRALLEREKELTRLSDEVARERRALPWVPVEVEYEFIAEDGRKTLAELFDGRSQLIVYHFMFGPDWEEGCPSCSSLGDHIEIPRVHLEHHDVTWVAVSRAPISKLLAYREHMGWTFPWVSSYGSDFNFDFGVSSTDERPLLEYNYRAVPSEARSGGRDELPGASMFALRDGVVHHTYSTYARGLDAMWGMFQWLDRAPLGRNEADGYWIPPPRPVRDSGRLMQFAHVAGVPVEELLPFALVSGAGLLAAARAWVREAIRRARGSSAAPPPPRSSAS